MRPHLLRALAVVAVLSTGCGAPGHGDARTGRGPWAFAGCPADSPAVRSAAPLLRVDLDGDGRPDTVRVTSHHARRCGDALVVTLGGQTTGLSLKATGIERGSARVVAPPGRKRQMLYVTGLPHPRGGYQPYLVGLGDGGLGEVTVSGNPVLPFVATDGGGEPATAVCTAAGGVATITASSHEPPGDALAWDVRRTTYSVHGTTASPTWSGIVKSAVADPTLRREMPELFRPTFFGDCSTR